MGEEKEVVRFNLTEDHQIFQPGKPFTLKASVSVKKSWHINSMQPLDAMYIPTKFTIDHPSFELENVRAPAHSLMTLSFSPEPLAVYDGDLEFLLTIRPSADAGGTPDLPVTFSYQACNNSVCLPPDRITRTLQVEVSGATIPAASGNRIEDWVRGKGIFLTLLLVFIGGLALNLTPCVYPMIPITLGFFAGQAKERQGRVLPLALLYFAGITLIYSLLGTLAALTGGLFGNLLQFPPVLIAVAAVLVVLSLSMFDVYKLQLPSSFISRLSGKRGLLGAFFMGGLVGLVAAPCIGPIVLGLLTYVAAVGDAFTGFILFFALSAGLGLPYVFLGLFSGSLRRLPHSGNWMATVERIFGFLLLAAAVYILRPLLPEALELFFYILLLFACGVVLVFFMPATGESSTWRIFRRVLGLAFLLGSVILAVAAFFPASGGTSGESLWKPYSVQALQKARENGVPVIIDFTADWCLPCRELDHKTFSHPGVRERLGRMAALKADLTHSGSPEVQELASRFKIRGVPTVVFMDREGNMSDDLNFVGFVDADTMIAKLDRLLPSPEE